MKKLILVLSIIFIGCETNQNRDNATWTFDSSTGDYIEWQSDNDFANEMTNAAFVHLYNVEYEKAMVFFEKALEYDPSLFGPHVVLAGLSPEGSEKSEMHIKKAKENVADNNDTSKLFVSLLDLPRQSRWWPLLGPEAHDKWAEMRTIEPKGKLIHYYYSFTIPGLENKIREMESLLSELKDGVGESESLAVSGDHSYMIAPITNVLGYFYYNQGDKEKAKSLFEEYIDLRPNGYNSYDSMGEFYYNVGDLESAKSYYSKAVENYFGANTANRKLRELNAE
jgi:Tfp pilus assembly protein PilF